MSLTIIAILAIIVGLAIIWLSGVIVITTAPFLTIISRFGKPIRIKKPGLKLNLYWPVEMVSDRVSTERRTFNIEPFIVNCIAIKPENGRKELKIEKNGVIPLKTGEISIHYRVDFTPPKAKKKEKAKPKEKAVKLADMLDGYYRLVGETGKWDKEKIEKEILKDPFQGHFKDKTRDKAVNEAISAQTTLMNEVKEDMQKNFEKNNFPLKISDIITNVPLQLVDSAQEAAFKAKATAQLREAAAISEQNLQEYEAKRQIEIQRLHAEAEGINLKTLAEKCGIKEGELPQAEYVQNMLTVKSLKIYEILYENPNSKYVINSSSILNEITTMLMKAGGK